MGHIKLLEFYGLRLIVLLTFRDFGGPYQKLIDHQKRLNIFGQSCQNGEHKAQENIIKFHNTIKDKVTLEMAILNVLWFDYDTAVQIYELRMISYVIVDILLPWHSGRSLQTEMLCSIWPEQCPTFPGPSRTDSILRRRVRVAERGPQLALQAVQPLQLLHAQASLFDT